MHQVRDCPLVGTDVRIPSADSRRSSTPQQQRDVRDVRRLRYGSNGPNKACMWIKYSKYKLSALLDTGSDVSIAGEEVAERLGWRIVEHRTKQVNVANNEPMHVTGAAYVELKVGNQTVEPEILITPDLEGLILRIDFLRRQSPLKSNLTNERVCFGSTDWIPTHSEEQTTRICRIILANNAVIPALGQATVPVRMPYNRWHREEPHTQFSILASEAPLPHQQHVYAGRTVLPIRPSDLQIPILNTRQYEQSLAQGTCLGKVYEAATVRPPQLSGIREEENPELTEDVVEQMMGRLYKELNVEQRQKVRCLLSQYRSILSTRDDDIGRTHLLEHTIDTGDHKPIRQPLRRQPF